MTPDQIRWRRWKIAEKMAIRKSGQMGLMFLQEFAEDDETCFLTAGDMYYDADTVNLLVKGCYDAPLTKEGLSIWKTPEEVAGLEKVIVCDPSQAKVSQTAITVWAWTPDGHVIHCATDAGWYPAEATGRKMKLASEYYGGAMMIWEANSHGLALSEVLKYEAPIYYRTDIISGVMTRVPGWLTTSNNKNLMWQKMSAALSDMEIHDISFVSQLRNIRISGDKVIAVGPDDIHDSGCIALVTHTAQPIKKGMMFSLYG